MYTLTLEQSLLLFGAIVVGDMAARCSWDNLKMWWMLRNYDKLTINYRFVSNGKFHLIKTHTPLTADQLREIETKFGWLYLSS